jgi:hypothetical protein
LIGNVENGTLILANVTLDNVPFFSASLEAHHHFLPEGFGITGKNQRRRVGG